MTPWSPAAVSGGVGGGWGVLGWVGEGGGEVAGGESFTEGVLVGVFGLGWRLGGWNGSGLAGDGVAVAVGEREPVGGEGVGR